MQVLSKDPEMARLASGVTLTAQTKSVCPLSVLRGCPVSRSHSMQVLSLDPEMARLASGVTLANSGQNYPKNPV